MAEKHPSLERAGVSDFNQPKRTPNHPTKSHVVVAKKGDKIIAFADEAPVDTVLGVDIFPVVHVKTQEKIYVSLEDIKDDN